MANSYIDLSLESNNIKIKAIDNGDGTYSIGSAGTGGSVSLDAGENHVGEVGGHITIVSAEFTRAGNTTGYHANDYVSPSGGALVELPLIGRADGETGYIVGARLSTDTKSLTPRFRVHLFNASNPTLAVDGANWLEKYADKTKRVGYFDLSAMATAADTTNSDMSRAYDFTLRIPFSCGVGSRSLWYGLETLDAFTPASGEKFSLMLYADVN